MHVRFVLAHTALTSITNSTKPGTTYLIVGAVHPEDDYRVVRNSSLVRVETSRSTLVVRSLGENVCEYAWEFLDDPKMTIPKWLFNWFVKTGIPKGRTKLREAVAGYATYMSTYECDFDISKFISSESGSADAKQKKDQTDAPKDEAEPSASASASASADTVASASAVKGCDGSKVIL